MSSDQAAQVQKAPGPDWGLPAIADVKIRSAKFEPRATRNFANPTAPVDDAVEIVISLESPMPIRAQSPVLWVGGERLTESEAVDKDGKQVRFWSFNRAKLRSGAPIALSWMNEDPPKTMGAAKFTYRPPE